MNITHLRKNLKGLMLEQIYPAVLGSFVFLVFETGLKQITSFISNVINGVVIYPEPLLRTKFCLVLTAVFFYFADYYYIKLTQVYRVVFFVFNLIFAFTLLATVKFTNLDTNEAPDVNSIALSYFIFIIFYLVWDIVEWKTCAKRDRKLYLCVIAWEILSLIFFASVLYFKCGTTTLLCGLVAVTAIFWYLVYKKGEFANGLH
jgi:hypothetical protein